jgi:phosphate transport system substrate-binding protein
MKIAPVFHRASLLSWSFALCCAMALTQVANAQTVRLHGAVAFAKAFDTKKAAIESQSGAKLEVVGNGAGRGLADLAAGNADVALLAGSLKGVADAMNKEKAGSVDSTQMKEIPISASKAAFVTHPSAGVKSLTDAQLRDVLTGKATNWKEVGGADQAIKLVLPFGADGVRVTVQSSLLQGADYAKGAIIRSSSKDVAAVIAQLPGACATLGVQNVQGNITQVTTEKEITIPWSLVVKGEPSGDVKKVIEAATALIK